MKKLAIEDVIFWGVNIVEEVSRVIHSDINDQMRGMTKSQKKSYKLGIDNALSLIKSLYYDPDLHIDGEITFIAPELDTAQEFSLPDLVERVNNI